MESELKQSKMLAEYFDAKRLEAEDRLRRKEDELRQTEDRLAKLQNVIKAKVRCSAMPRSRCSEHLEITSAASSVSLMGTAVSSPLRKLDVVLTAALPLQRN